MNLLKQYGCLKLINFSKKFGPLSSTGSEILASVAIARRTCNRFICFIPKFKLKYDDLENIKTDRVNTVVFDLHQIKQSKFFGGHSVVIITNQGWDLNARRSN